MADVNLSYNEYQALLDKIKALENEKLEHLKLINDRVGMIVIQRSVRGTLDQYALNDIISNYNHHAQNKVDRNIAVTEIIRVLKELEVTQEYVVVSDIGEEIVRLNKELNALGIEYCDITTKNEDLSRALAKLSDYSSITNENYHRLSHKISELTTDSERVSKLVEDMQHKLDGYYLMEIEYRKVEHYLSEIDTMIAHQKNLEEELDKLKSVILFVSNKVRYSIWGVGKAIKNFLTNNT